jgi:hypothetical protein
VGGAIRTGTGLFLLALVAGGCATTTRGRGVAETGFLGADASLLQPGGAGEAQLRYLRPNVDWPSYTSILLDPVTVWRSADSRSSGVPAADAQALTDYFYGVIRESLEKQGFQLVSAPAAHTLRVKVALAQASASHVVLDVVSTVVPSAHALSTLDKLITGKPAFVGEAQVEVKATDSVTGELLAAGVDHRVGGKALTASQFNSWGDVERMMRLWASHGSYRLCELARRPGCVAPDGS